MDDGVVDEDRLVDGAELIDANAPACPSCAQPMDVVIGSWWCLECQEAVQLDAP